MRLLTLLCGVAVLFSACRRQEGSAEPRAAKEADAALFPVNVSGKYGFINSKGSLMIPAQFDAIPSTGTDYGPDYFPEGLAAVCIGPCDYVKTGELLTDEYGRVEQAVWRGNWGYIDRTGRFVINPQFSEAGGFSHGLASAITGERKLYGDPRNLSPHCGYIDHTGKFVIPAQFAICTRFDDAGMAAVAIGDVIDNSMGFINTEGRFLINPRFYAADTFRDGLAAVTPTKEDRFTSYIDRSGKFVWQAPKPSTTSGPQTH